MQAFMPKKSFNFWIEQPRLYSFFHVFAITHNAEQPMKIIALFVSIRSVSQGAVDLMGWCKTSFAALTALVLQLGMVSQSQPLDVI